MVCISFKGYSLKVLYIVMIQRILQFACPVGWCCRIHWLLLCRKVRLPTPTSILDTKQSDGEVTVMLELWGMLSTSSLPMLPSPLYPGVVVPDRVLSMGPIEQNGLLELNWIAWNRTVLTFKLRTYAKLNCLNWHCFCMLNWIIWNKTVFDIETVLTLNWIVWRNWIPWNINDN